jgi:biotin carboxyl carrier protein
VDYNYRTSGGEVITLRLIRQSDGSYSATFGDRTVHVTLEHSSPNQLLLHVDGKSFLVYAAHNGTAHYIALNGQVTTLERVTGENRPASAHHHAGDLTASMPGQIVQILVSPGDTIQQGQTLLIMEAMKMETRLTAPYTGFVKLLLCSVGQPVERGQKLLEIEPELST